MTGALDVDGATTLDDVTVDGSATLNGATTVDDDLNVTGNAGVTGNLDVDGATTLDDVTVDGTATLNGATTINDNLVVDGDLSNSGNAVIASDSGSNASIGNPTGTTDLNGTDVNVGANATTIDIGNPTSTTTLDGTVVFTSPLTIPLSEDALLVGNASNVADELATTNDPGAVLQQDSAGTPVWSRDLDVNDVAVDGDLAVAGNTNLVGNLDVDGATTLNDLTADGTTTLNGATTVDDNLNVTGNTDVVGDLDVDGATTLNDLTADGTTTLNGATTVDDNLNVTGNADVVGNLDVDGATTLNDLTADGTTTLNGATTIDDNLNVTGNADVVGALDVDGTTTLNGATTVDDNLNVTGNADVTGDLDVDGATTLNGITTINDNLVINGDLSNSGNALIASDSGSNASIGNPTGITDLNGSDVNVGANATTIDIGNPTSTTTIDGTIVFNNAPSLPLSEDALLVGNISDVAAELTSTNDPGAVLQQDSTGTPIWSRDLDVNDVAVDGDLAVAGNTNLVGNLDVDGATTLNDLTADGTTTLNGATTVDDNLNVTGNTDVVGALDVDGTTTLNGATTVDDNLNVTGNADVVGNLDVDGATTLNDLTADGTTTLNGATTVDDNLNVTGNADVVGALDVDGATTLNDLTADGTTTLNGITTINDNLVINGDLSNSGNALIASDSGSNASIGNPTGIANLNGSDVNIGENATTIDIGNPTSTTTIDGTVLFANAPALPLGQNALLIGDSAGVAAELATTNDPGAVLQQDSTGRATWSRDLAVNDVTVDGAQINNGDVLFNGTSVTTSGGTTSTFNGPVDVEDDLMVNGGLTGTGDVTLATANGSDVSIGSGTGDLNLQGENTNLSTTNVVVGPGPEASITLGYNDADGAGPDNPSSTTVNGNISIGSSLGDNGGPTTMTVEGDAVFNGDVTFDNMPDLPLDENALLVGSPSGIAEELSSTNVPGAVLQQDSTGTPFWSRDLNVENVAIVNDLSVTGRVTTTEIVVEQNAFFNDDVLFDGNVAINGGTFVTSDTTVSTFNGPVNIGNDVSIDGGLTATGDVVLAGASGSNATIGNSEGVTMLDGDTISIGNIGSAIMMNGNITFGAAASFALPYNSLLVGDANYLAAELPSTNQPGAVLVQDALGTPIWSRDLNVDNIITTQSLRVDGSTTLGDGDDDIALNSGTGALHFLGLDSDASPDEVVTIDPLGRVTLTSLADLGNVIEVPVVTDATLTGDGTTGNAIGVNLANANTWTATQTFGSVDVNAGFIDGAAVGAVTPSSGRFTTLGSASTTDLGDGAGIDNVTVNVGTGDLSLLNLAADAAPVSVVTLNGGDQARVTTIAELGAALDGTVGVAANGTLVGDGTASAPLGVNLANANTWTATQSFNSVDVNGGVIDGTTVGAVTPSSGQFTTLGSASTTDLGDGTGADNVNVNVGTGDLSLLNLAADAAPVSVVTLNGGDQARQTTIAELGAVLDGTVGVATNSTLVGDGTAATPLGVDMASANNWTAQQTFASVDVNGGAVDATPIGGGSPSTGRFTALGTTSTTDLGDGSGVDNVTVNTGTGNLTLANMAVDTAPVSVVTLNGSDQARETTIAELGTAIGGAVPVATNTTLAGNGTAANPLRVNLTSANTWSALQIFGTVDINGGAIDATAVGAATPATGRFTTLGSTSTANLGDGAGADNVTVNVGTGNLALIGLTGEAAPVSVVTLNGGDQARETTIAELGTAIGGAVPVASNTTLNGNGTTASPLGLNLTNANSWSALQTFGTVDINGGVIDATAVGTVTPATGRFTSLRSSSTTEIGDGTGADNVTVNMGTGNLSLIGLTGDTAPVSIVTLNGADQARETTIDELGAVLGGNVAVVTDSTLRGDGSAVDPLGVDLNGAFDWTGAQTFSDIAVNGATTLGDGDDNVTVNVGTGELTLQGIDADAAPTDMLTLNGAGQLRTSNLADLASGLDGTVAVMTDASLNGDGTTAAPLSVNLANANAWTATQTFADADIDGGSIDGTAIGSTTAGTGAFTDLSGSGNATLGDGNGDAITLDASDATTGGTVRIDVTNGALDIDGVTEDNTQESILVTDAAGRVFTRQAISLVSSVSIDSTFTGNGTPAAPFGVDLAETNLWTGTQTFTDLDVIGTTTLGDGNADNVTVDVSDAATGGTFQVDVTNGAFDIDGLTLDNSQTTMLVTDATGRIYTRTVGSLGGAVSADSTIIGDGTASAPLGVDLTGTNLWTGTQTFADVDVIGNTTLGDGNGDDITLDASDAATGGTVQIDVTNGALDIAGVTEDNTQGNILVTDAAGRVFTRQAISLVSSVSTDSTFAGNGTPAAPFGVDLAETNLWTGTQTFTDLDVIGNTTLGDGSGDNVSIDVTSGLLDIDGLTTDNTQGNILVTDAAGQVYIRSIASIGAGAITTDGTLMGNGTPGTPLGVNLANANTWTALQTFNAVDINGGTIDGTAIGSTTPSSGAFTGLSSNGATTLGDGDDNVTVNVGTGELTLQGIDADAAPTDMLTLNGAGQLRISNLATLASGLDGTVAVMTDASLNGDGTTADPLSVNLANANAWTATQTFADADIDGGSIDGTAIGSTTAGTGAFTDLSASGNTTLGDGNGDAVTLDASSATTGGTVRIDVTNGALDIDGVTQDNTQGDILVTDATGRVFTRSAGTIVGTVSTNVTLVGNGSAASPLGVNLANANSWTATQTFAGVDINSGTIDGAEIGSAEKAAAHFTSLHSNDVTDLGDGDDNVTINVGTGELSLQGLDAEATPTTLLTINGADQVTETSVADLATLLAGDVSVTTNATLTGDGTTASPLGVNLANTNTWTATQTFANADLNGGTVDGTAIGAATASTGRFTTLTAVDDVFVGDGDDNVVVNVGTGEISLQGLDAEPTTTTLLSLNGANQMRTTSVDDLAALLSGDVALVANATLTGNGTAASPLGVDLANTNTWTAAQTFTTATINGGAINGATIGATTRSSGAFTTLNANGTTTLGDGDDAVTLNVGTGELSLQGIDAEAAPTTLVTMNGANQVRTATVSSLGTALSGTIGVARNATLNGNGTTGSPLGINLTNANSWTAAQTFTAATINGGAINGTTIGATTQSSGAFTILNANGTTTLGDGDDVVTVNVGTGELALQGIDAEAAPTTLVTMNGANQVRTATVSSLGTALSGTIGVASNATLNGNGTTGSPLGINLTNANSWTAAQTFTTATINGGAINGTTIGATTRSSGAFTTLNANGATTLGDGDDNVTVNVGTGELALQGVDAEAAPTTLVTMNGANQVRTATMSSLGTALSGTIGVASNATLNGNGTTGSPLAINLANANSWTGAQTFASTDIDGGTIDNTAIGATTRSSGAFTTLAANGATALGNGDDNVTVNVGTGELALQGIDADAAPATLLTMNASNQIRTTTMGSLGTALSGTIGVASNATLTGNGTTGNPLGVNLANANSWSGAQTFGTANINGGAINGTAIGATTRSTGAFTTLNANGSTTLGDGNGDNITLNASSATTGGTVGINVTNGTLDIDGLTVDNTVTSLMVVDATGLVRTRTVASLSGNTSWSLTGNAGTSAATNFLGTTDNVDLILRTNNVERMRIEASGHIGIGTSSPSEKLEILNGNLLLSNTGTAGELRLAEPVAGGTQYTAFKAGAQGANITYTLPTTQGAAGTVIGNDGTGALSWSNPNQNGSIGSEDFKRKTANETLTNSTTLQNDDHLFTSVDASRTYKVEGFLYVRASANNTDMKIAFDVPTGSTIKITYVAYDGANNVKGGGFLTGDATASSAIDINANATTDVAVWYKGLIIVGSTAGTAQLQWAMANGASGETLTVELNSFLEAQRVE